MTGNESTDDLLLNVKIGSRKLEAEGIISLKLDPCDGGTLPAFRAGAHIDVHLSNGLVRQYSLYGDPSDTTCYQIAVLREPNGRGGSRYVHDELREGDMLRISSPRNHFPLIPASHTLLFAGGIGITPLLSMARELYAQRASFELHYCVRSLARAAFSDWLAASDFEDNVRLHIDEGPDANRLDAGRLCRDAIAGAHLYVCGPSGFMTHVISTAQGAGWDDARIHREYFAPPAETATSGEVFELECARAGKLVPVADGQSIAAALRSHGIEVPLSCEQGICGTCSIRVLDGIPDHRDHFLTASEKAANDRLLACCSRARSARLVLDL